MHEFLFFLGCGHFALEMFDFFVEFLYFLLGLVAGLLKFEVFFVLGEELVVEVFGLVLELPEDYLLFLVFFLPVLDLGLDVLLGLDQVVDLIFVVRLHVLVVLLLCVQFRSCVVELLSQHLILRRQRVKLRRKRTVLLLQVLHFRPQLPILNYQLFARLCRLLQLLLTLIQLQQQLVVARLQPLLFLVCPRQLLETLVVLLLKNVLVALCRRQRLNLSLQCHPVVLFATEFRLQHLVIRLQSVQFVLHCCFLCHQRLVAH